MAITAAQVKELREKTGAGIMDAKKALVEVDGNMDQAIDLLREKGIAKAAKKADRVAAEGLTGVYVDGNVAAVVEVNSETDFVAKNDQFVTLVNETAELIAKNKPANTEEALAIQTAAGKTLAEAYVEATSTIGEKIAFRRFALLEKTDDQNFGAYQHNGGRIGVLTVLDGGDEALPKAVAMHVAAMSPSVLAADELDHDFVISETTALISRIEIENEDRKRTGKAFLTVPRFGSASQLTDDVLAEVEAAFKEELKAEGKPEKIWDKILPGKLAKFRIDNTQIDQENALLAQLYVMDDSKTVEKFLESKNAKVVTFVRFEVGEGIEKAANNFEAEVQATMAAALEN
ncbi:elongation factor Ts [Lactococcus hodotermopsidis]|uniref:Elongation factor Ts n=2 Tax=Pseudolactococcus hodotermopsidis TaxID=2709157 RepID=A0A6A0BDK0_9LACT|nr:elongation factor Ts [Lactococcus hodotermopsidis]